VLDQQLYRSIIMIQGKGTLHPYYLVIVACSSRKINTFVDSCDCDQGMLDCWFRVADLQEQVFPEVRILMAKYFPNALEAKEMVSTPFLVVSRYIDIELYNSSRNVAVTSSPSACTSQAGRLLFAALDAPNPGPMFASVNM
jgi:hypothetical protein